MEYLLNMDEESWVEDSEDEEPTGCQPVCAHPRIADVTLQCGVRISVSHSTSVSNCNCQRDMSCGNQILRPSQRLANVMETATSGCLRLKALKKSKALSGCQLASLGKSKDKKTKKAINNSCYMPTVPEEKVLSDIMEDKENMPCPAKLAKPTPPKIEKSALQPMETVFENSDSDKSSEEVIPQSKYAKMGIRGQLKIALSMNNDLLTVHVMKAKHLKSRSGSQCCSFVRMSLMPEDGHTSQCETEAVADSNAPVFDEKVTYELIGEDRRRRLIISVWNKTEHSVEMLGCMSFGLKHLMQKTKSVSGWYYLLGDKVGQRKHLKVGQDPHGQSSKSLSHQAIILALQRGASGFGFTVKGASPVTVARVEPGTPAGKAGLRTGDFIIRINSIDMSTASSVDVASTIGSSLEQMTMEIHRSHDQSWSWSRSTLSLATSCGSEDFSDVDTEVSQDAVFSISHLHSSSKVSSKSQSSTVQWNSLDSTDPWSTGNSSDPFSWQPRRTGSCDGASDHDNWSVEKECIDMVSSLKSAAEPIKKAVSQKSSKLVQQGTASGVLSSTLCESVKGDADQAMENLWKNVCSGGKPEANMTMLTCIEGSGDQPAPSTPVRDQTTYGTQLNSFYYDSPTIIYKSLSEKSRFGSKDLGCYQALDGLLKAEQHFVDQMQRGAQCFSRPLRHGLLTASEHATLFQNVEKLVVISEFHLKEVREFLASLSDPKMRSAETMVKIGHIYKPRLVLLVDAYSLYARGLPRSLNLLDDLAMRPQFRQFLQQASSQGGHNSILQYLHMPVEHVQTLLSHFETLLACASRQSPDHTELLHIVLALKNAQHVSANPEGYSTEIDGLEDTSSLSSLSGFSGFSNQSSVISACSSVLSDRSSRSGRSSRSSRSSRSNLPRQQSVIPLVTADAELLALQRKLVFPPHIKPSPIVAPNRHVIFSGELLFVDGWRWNKLLVVLCSDLLLLLRPENVNQFVVAVEPIQLQDVINADFNCFHPCEFVVNVQPQMHQQEAISLVFRASVAEQKCTWHHLLKQRVAACKSRSEYFL